MVKLKDSEPQEPLGVETFKRCIKCLETSIGKTIQAGMSVREK